MQRTVGCLAVIALGCRDASVDQLSAENSQLQADIAALQDQIDLIEQRLVVAESEAADQSGTDAGLTTSVASLTADLASLTAEVDAITGSVDLTDLAEDIDAASTSIAYHEARLINLEGAGFALESWVLSHDYIDSNAFNTGLVANNIPLQGAIDLNGDDIAANSMAISGNSTGIAANSADVAGNTSTVVSHGDRLDQLELDVDGNIADISGNATAIAVNDQSIQGVSSQSLINAAGIVGLNDSLADQTALLVGLQGDVSSNSASIVANALAIGLNADAVAAEATSVEALENAVGALVVAGDALQVQVDGLVTDVEDAASAADNANQVATGVALVVGEHTGELAILQLLGDDVAQNQLDISANAAAVSVNIADIAGNVANIATSLYGHAPALWEMSTTEAIDGHVFGRSGALMLTSEGAFLQHGPVVATVGTQVHRVTFYVEVPAGGASVGMTLCGGGVVNVEVDGVVELTSLNLAGGCQPQTAFPVLEGSHSVGIFIEDPNNNSGFGVLNPWISEAGVNVDYSGLRGAATGGI